MCVIYFKNFFVSIFILSLNNTKTHTITVIESKSQTPHGANTVRTQTYFFSFWFLSTTGDLIGILIGTLSPFIDKKNMREKRKTEETSNEQEKETHTKELKKKKIKERLDKSLLPFLGFFRFHNVVVGRLAFYSFLSILLRISTDRHPPTLSIQTFLVL